MVMLLLLLLLLLLLRRLTRFMPSISELETMALLDDPAGRFGAANKTRHISHVTRHTSHVTCHTSHVTRHTSQVKRHTSDVRRHTSRITPGLFCVRYSLDRNGGFLVDWSESAGEGSARNYRRAKIVTVKRGYAALPPSRPSPPF
jgi:hypothetical protein